MKENQPAKKKKKPVDPSRSLIVIGGGAAGLMAAVQAAKTGVFVTLLEHNEKTGRKIAVTGNGRCNLTNLGSVRRSIQRNPSGICQRNL